MQRLNRFKGAWKDVAAVTITLTMLVWAGHSLARFIWLWGPEESLDALAWDAAENFPQERDVVDMDAIRRAFSLSHSAGEATVGDGGAGGYGQTSETRLELTLRGAVFSTDPRQSRAIIASGDQQQVYRTGEQIKNTVEGVELTAVFHDHVILMNNGREERLRIDNLLDSSQEGNKSPEGSVLAKSGDVPTTFIAAARDTSMSNAGALSKVLRLQVYQQEGQILGLQIRHGSRADLLADVGLYVGDVITAIDETPIFQVSQLSGLLGRFEQPGEVALQVQRRGETITVNVNSNSFGLDSK